MGRVVSQNQLIALAGPAVRGPRRVVFTNGCFDLLHPGHIHTLEQARSFGDLLVLGLNSDASVRRMKGSARPLVNEGERAELLASLEAVDFVVIFDEDTPRELIGYLLPDVLLKGADWSSDKIVGREEVESRGGRVISVALDSDYSTTRLLTKIQASQNSSGAEKS